MNHNQDFIGDRYLNGNSIATIDGLKSCARLEELHLANQQLEPDISLNFDINSLQTIAPSLRILNLENCQISSARSLQILGNLEQLHLRKNEIQDIDVRTSRVCLAGIFLLQSVGNHCFASRTLATGRPGYSRKSSVRASQASGKTNHIFTSKTK